MPSSRIPSPARSQGVISTPRKQLRRTRSVGSPARTNLRLSSIIESYKISPVPSRQSVLNDDTDIEVPRRGSWWKKINDNSRDVLELLERKELIEDDNVAEEFDVEVLSQEKKNYTLDLPDSSDGESICSIVIPQRNLFIQKDHQPQIKFGQIKNSRETLQKLDKSYVDHDKEVNIGRKTLFSQPSKTRTKPVFPAALLNISANKTINKTKEIPAAEVKGQVRNLFGGKLGTKRKNMFADFIASESEDDIPEIQPKVFGFQKRNEPKRRASSMSRHSPTSSIDLEMEDWRLLPSSTMVENHIDEATSPVKRIKLSNLLETNDSEISTNSNHTINKTKQINKSVVSKNKSKNISNTHHEDNKSNEKNITSGNNRVTRSMSKSLTENSVNASNTSKNLNKTENPTHSNPDRSRASKSDKTSKNISQRNREKVQQNQNMLMDQVDPDEDFTLEYDNDDNEVLEMEISIKNDNKILAKESRGKIIKENFVEQQKSINEICKNQEELLDNKQNENEVSNYSKIGNNSQEKNNLVGLNRDTYVRLNKSVEKTQHKNDSKSMIRNSVEKYNDQSRNKDMPKKLSSQRQSNKSSETNAEIDKSSQSLNEENAEVQEMASEIEKNECDNHSEQHISDIEEEVKKLTNEENKCSEIEEEKAIDEENNDYEKVESNVEKENESQNEHVPEEEVDNEEQIIRVSNIDESDRENILGDRSVNIKDSSQVTLPNISHNTTGRQRKIIKSPEAILHDKTKQIDSFTVQGRNTSVRKTKSIIFHNKLETVTDFHRTTGFSDGTYNSTAEGSGWDSHRTTRKTLRQTFGKDFTPRKSLRALVMEKTAKLQANFTGIENNVKMHQANSTEYDNVQDELDSNQETELVQFQQNINMVEVEERNKTIQNEYEKIYVRHGAQQFEGRDETDPSKERDKRDQTVERDEIDQSKKRGEIEKSKERDKVYQSEKRKEMEESEGKDEMEVSEGEEMEESDDGEVMEQSEERKEMDQSEEREKMSQSGERKKMEQTDEREEMEQPEEKEEMEESDERNKSEQSENEERDITEELGKKDDIEQSENEEKEESEQSENEERQESEQFENEERQESEQSENEERDITEEFGGRDDIEQSENEEREESEQSENEERQKSEHFENEEGQESEQSENEERDITEEFGGRDDIEQSENVEREESEQSKNEERQESEQSENEERDITEEFGGRDDIEQSENEEREESEQSENEERPESEQSENEERDITEEFGERDETIQDDEMIAEESYHEVSNQTRQTSLERYLQKIKLDNAEKRRKMQEELRNSLKNPKRDTFNMFKIPQRPVRRNIKIQKPKAKQIKSVLPLEMLPSEIIEDMKYKPPKRFQPNNASWITKRLYKFLENKLESKYDYKARIRAEKLVQCIYLFTKEVRRHDSVRSEGIEELKREMARLDIVKTHFDFYEFCHEFFPREIRIKVVPDIVNNISLPRHGVFSDILQ